MSKTDIKKKYISRDVIAQFPPSQVPNPNRDPSKYEKETSTNILGGEPREQI